MVPLPPARDLATLEIEMNETLASLGWGEVRLQLLRIRPDAADDPFGSSPHRLSWGTTRVCG